MSKIIAYVLLLLVVAGVFGFVAYFTNGFTGDFKSFYVVVNDKNVLSTESGVEVSPDTPLTGNVKYTFGAVSKEISGYELVIQPAADFDFTVDGVAHSFADEKDLKNGFEISGDETTFTIKPKGALMEILKGNYPDKEIVINKSTVPTDKDLFKVIVYSKDKTASVTIGCVLKDMFMEGVRLDKEVIVF